MYIGFVSVVKAEVFSSFFKNGYFRYCHTGVLLGFFKKWKLLRHCSYSVKIQIALD